MPGVNGKYFSYLPTIPYKTFDDTTDYKVVTNIFKRVRATLEARTDKSIYYDYRVREGQLPEHVAYNYYGSANYHWVVLLMNEIRDPQWGWPLNSFAFERYIVNKYGSTEAATSEVLYYETKEIVAETTDDNYTRGDIILRSGIRVSSTFDFAYKEITNGVVGTLHEYPNTQAAKSITAYDFEVSENDRKSDIILLRRNLLAEFVDTFESLVVVRR